VSHFCKTCPSYRPNISVTDYRDMHEIRFSDYLSY
jgi:hypothetical protein